MTEQDLIGKKLGNTYEIQELIGSGGMARVYRGFDHTLQRPVAIKILTEAAAAQPGLPERFRQEARLIASLQHPHIVHVYAFGEEEGLTYMVEQLLPGPTLKARLQNQAASGQPFTREQVVTMMTQLASALDAAHAAGIIHRDVKPENAMWNANGVLVLTDFGIARQMVSDTRHTQTGMIIGTPDYLSPEQAQGSSLTQASDIYSLGVVLYELLSGEVPFEGETPMRVVMAHINAPPPPPALKRSDLPPAVDAVVQRALAKDPAERFQSASALATALDRAWSRQTPVVPPGPAPTPDLHDQATRVWQEAPPPPTSQRTRVAPPPPATAHAPSRQATPAPTAEKQRSSKGGLLIGLLLLLLIGGAIVALLLMMNNDDSSNPAVADLVTETATTAPGEPTATPEPTATSEPTATPEPTIPPEPTPIPTPAPPTLPTGQLTFASQQNGAFNIHLLQAGATSASNLTEESINSYHPVLSPDRQQIAFHSKRDGDFDIYVMNRDGSNLRNLTNNNHDDQWPDWSPDGSTLVFAAEPGGNWDVYTIPATGGDPTRLTDDFAGDFAPVWSPDGSRIAFTSNRDGNDEIYLMSANGSNETNLTSHPAADKEAAWSPDGSTLALMSNRAGNDEIYLMSANGSNPRNLTNQPSQDTQPTWSPAGDTLAFVTDRDGNTEIYLINRDGSNPRNLTNSPYKELDPMWTR